MFLFFEVTLTVIVCSHVNVDIGASLLLNIVGFIFLYEQLSHLYDLSDINVYVVILKLRKLCCFGKAKVLHIYYHLMCQ